MKIRYTFVTGEIQDIEVNAQVGEVIAELNRLEYNNNHTETRRHISLNEAEYEGDQYKKADPLRYFIQNENSEVVREVIAKLSLAQRELITAIYENEATQEKYAADQGVSQSAISARLATIRRLLKKVFEAPL